MVLCKRCATTSWESWFEYRCFAQQIAGQASQTWSGDRSTKSFCFMAPHHRMRRVHEATIPCSRRREGFTLSLPHISFVTFKTWWGIYRDNTFALELFPCAARELTRKMLNNTRCLEPNFHVHCTWTLIRCNQPYSFSITVALCGLVGMREAWGILIYNNTYKEDTWRLYEFPTIAGQITYFWGFLG